MNSGRLLSIRATVSPFCSPSCSSPPAIRLTQAESSFQVIETESSSVRRATSSPILATVLRNAS